MRFTVKAKLASAFSAIMILSMVVGAVAYIKLSSLDASQQSLVRQAERMKKAADLMNTIQGQLRSESRMIQAVTDKDTVDNLKEMVDRRGKALKLKDELHSLASENGRRLIEGITPKFQRMNELQDQAGKLALLNSNNHAAAIWTSEGQPALTEFNSAVDAASAEINKATATSEGLRALVALQTSKFEAARLARSIVISFAATSVEELETEFKAAAGLNDGLKASVAQSSSLLAPLGLPANEIKRQFERFSKMADRC